MLNITWALKNHKPIHISEVERGLACGCICPVCNETLIAKKGDKNTHHFSHQSGSDCEYSYETSLHIMAKEVLLRTKTMVLPYVYVDFETWSECLEVSKEITIDWVELEKRFNGVIPDVVVYSGDKCFFVEIFVTHRIDDEKLNKLKALGIPTIEIDLSKIDRSVDESELMAILMEDDEESNIKYWKYHPLVDKYMQKINKVADNLPVVWLGNRKYTKDCPAPSVFFEGKSYADFKSECCECGYCVSRYNNHVLCVGRSEISSIEDLMNIHSV